MTQIFDRDQIVREFALTFIANTQKKSIRVYARKLWYHTCTQASHNRLKHWYNLEKNLNMKNGRVLGQYARLQFHKSLDNKSGPEKAKMYNANCRYVQVNCTVVHVE